MMNRLVADTPGKVTEIGSAFHIAVFYEDVPAAHYAKRAIDLLPEQLDKQSRMEITFWRLDIASLPPLRSMVVNDLRMANVLIVAANDPEEWVSPFLDLFAADTFEAEKTPDLLLLNLNEQSMRDIPAARPQSPSSDFDGKG